MMQFKGAFLSGAATTALMLLAACGGAAAPSSNAPASPALASSAPASKPAASASTGASASAKPSGSASGAPSAAPKPTATTLPVVDADTTKITLNKIPIPPIAGKTLSVDIMEVDQAAHMLYVTDRTSGGVDIFDVSTATAKYVTTVSVPNQGTNGLTIAKNVNKVLVGNNDSTASIIDIDPASPKVNTVIANLNTGGKKRTDETDYDPKEKKMYVANSDDQFVTVVDMEKNTIIKKIDLPGGALEQPRYNPSDGMMYLTGSEDNVLYQFDPTKDVMIKKTDIVDKCNPNGLAINPAASLALMVCSNQAQPQHLVVWDMKAGKVASTVENVGAGDAAFYSARSDRFLAACSNFFRGGQVAILTGAGKFITNVPTALGSHGLAYDETNKVVYTQDQLPNEGVMFSFPLPNK